MKKELPLLPIVQKYFENDPLAAAHSLETMDEENAIHVLKTIAPNLATDAVRYLNDAFAARLLTQLPATLLKRIINNLESQQAANIFLQFPPEMRQIFLDQLEEAKKKQIQELLTYPEDSAGRIMTTDLIAFHGDVRIKDAIQKIRQLAQKGYSDSYVYIIDKDNRLIGIMNMRDMILANEQSTMESAMRRDVFTINCFTDREKIANELLSKRYFAVPVVDNENRLLGVVKAERLIGHIQEEASEDIQMMFGAGGDEKAFSPIGFSLRTRLPWLHVNLLTAFLAASVVALFEDIIAKITMLAIYLPVVAGQGGNAGIQSLAVVMRGLVMREIPPNKVKQLILKEMGIGIINGLTIGGVTACIAWLWQGNPFLGIVVGLAMLVNLTVAGLAGAAIPIAMKAIRLDPAQCSGIMLTTITDIMGFFAFLGFAVLFQDYLM
jgi:magnesium transporter